MFSLIELKKFNFNYGKNTIFSDCDFELPENGLIAITGKSGSGKSTLLKIITGQLNINQECIESQIDKNDIIYVDQFASLKKDINIKMHFKLISKIYNRSFDLELINKAMMKVGLNYLNLDILVGKLSVGERKRLAIALALFADVKLLIIDEPTSSLDFTIKHQLMELLNEISKHRTVLIATHETEFDDLYDFKYEISDRKINLIFGNNITKNEITNSNNYKRNLFKISRYIGTKEKIGLLVLVVVLLFVSNLTVFQQIQLIFESQKVSEITNNMTKNNIFATFECVDRDLLPSDYTYSSYYDTGAEINLETVSKLKDTDHVLNVYPYYQLDSTDYFTRLKDVDNTISKVTILKNNQDFMSFELDSSKMSTPSIVPYYDEEIINNKHLSGNYINEDAAKELNLTEEDFEDKITLSIEVGMPICSTIANDRITYFENNVMQDTSYEFVANNIIYDKKTVTVDIDGILSNKEYENYYNSNGIGGLIYVNYNELKDIVASNNTKDINSRISLHEEQNEEITDLIPSNYNIIVDDVNNIESVKDQVLKLNKRLLTYIPYSYYDEVVSTQNSNINNSIILTIAYSLLSVAVILMILYRYNTTRKNDIVFYQGVSLDKDEIIKLYSINMLKAMIVFSLMNIFIYYMRIDYIGVYFKVSKMWLFFIFAVASIIIGIAILCINYFFIRYIVYDKAK